jgi:hypothetical protein
MDTDNRTGWIIARRGEYQARCDSAEGMQYSGWGPDVDGRICRMARFTGVSRALHWLDTVAPPVTLDDEAGLNDP